jgi:hypothetical protein
MVQELIDLRASIVERRYEDALTILDEMEWMSKEQILQNIESFLVRMLVHLIKNQVEQRLTNSWAASIEGSLIRIKKLNLKANKTSYYLKENEWEELLEGALNEAISPASAEIFEGIYSPKQLRAMIDREVTIGVAQSLLNLTYAHPSKELPGIIQEKLSELPGGEEWELGISIEVVR